ncbi:serine hydrolase domain-containing protein [Paenibacillus sp. 481]|uniref:serine hydrolase domain-containing protein n=1 Tax=Paenibacillus sp. 481 TaxID=2835869 RepID=UPI001E4F612F|nr:serine hydrolase [Paenibacillus sp. 481]UHA74010.1 serine hydrolase [Paenibacillus sp. 481]
MGKKLALYMLVAALLCGSLPAISPGQAYAAGELPNVDVAAIERYVEAQIKEADIPGAAVVVVSGDRVVYANEFGQADREAGIPVTSSTLFELGSTSKAFTALAILQLEQQGKIRLDDPVKRYIPWLELYDQGQPANVTIAQFLYQTSGVPFRTLASIPIGMGEGVLEETVRALSGTELDHRPGSKFLYATINYDVLGLVIQQVSGMSYEHYMSQLLQQLGLKNTVPMAQLKDSGKLATGYKVAFGSNHPYNAPRYQGNTPAGYLISNVEDIGQWLLLQLGAKNDLSAPHRELIKRSHISDTSVKPNTDQSYYAAGWSVAANGEQIWHQGSNPNYSSFFVLRPKERFGVGIMANINSAYTFQMGNGVMNLLRGHEPPPAVDDLYPMLDRIAFVVFIVLGVLVIVLASAAIRIGMQLRQRRRVFMPLKGRRSIVFAAILILAVACYWGIGKLFKGVFAGLPLDVVAVWAPIPVVWSAYALYIVGGGAFCYWLAAYLFPTTQRRVVSAPFKEVK